MGNGVLNIKYWKRYREIMRVFRKYGFSLPRVFSLRKPDFEIDLQGYLIGFTSPQRLRMVLEELGPTFIKIGQLLSVRPDLLGAEFVIELEKLQNEVPPFSFDMVRELFSRNKIDLDTEFEYIDPLPLAAASIAQVHRGRLKDGRDVAIKVQRLGIQKIIETDLSILRDICITLEKRTEWAKIYSLHRIVEELGQAIFREIDFSQEAKNMDQFCRNFKDNPNIIIPQVIWEYSSQAILTMEFVEGIKISDFTELDRQKIDRRMIVEKLIDLLFHQVYTYGFFHADPHPGNLSVGPNQEIIFYDFGQVGDIDNLLKENCIDLLVSMVRYDVTGVTRALLSIGVETQRVNRNELRRDVAKLQKKYYGMPMAQIEIGESLSEILELFTHYKIRIPAELSLLAKMLMTVEGLICQLDPTISIVDLAEPYGRKAVWQRFQFKNLVNDFENITIDYTRAIRDLPRSLETLLHMLTEGEIGINIDPASTDKSLGVLERLTNRMIIVFLLCSNLIGLSLISLSNKEVLIFDKIPLLESGFLLAVVLTSLLIVSIFYERKPK